MDIWARLFGSKHDAPLAVRPSGLLRDEDGWYYKESQDFSSTQQTLRIDQDRPGDWYVRDSFCEVEGINEPARAADVAGFFGGSYRWLHLERRPDGRFGRRTIAVFGSYLDKKGKERRAHLGFLKKELSDELGTEDVGKLWGRISFIKFPGRGRRPRYLIRFDLMVELADDTFE